MDEVEATKAPSEAVYISSILIDRLEQTECPSRAVVFRQSEVPEPFADLSIDSLLTVLGKLASLATYHAHQDAPVGLTEKIYKGVPIDPTISCGEAIGMMNNAADIICDWPQAVDAMFDTLATRNPNPSIDHPVRSIFATKAGYRLLGKIKDIDGNAISIIDDALETWLFSTRGIYLDARHRWKLPVACDVPIDAADALRRLEGRVTKGVSIKTWLDSGAISKIGNKISLASVQNTLELLARLPDSKFKHGLLPGDPRTRIIYTSLYKRSDGLRDLLAGKIRLRRIPGECLSGLASIVMSRDDLIDLSRAASIANPKRRLPKMNDEERRLWLIQQRVARAYRDDVFCRPGRLNDLINKAHVLPDPFDVTKHDRVRRKKSACGRMTIYSIVDALLIAKCSTNN